MFEDQSSLPDDCSESDTLIKRDKLLFDASMSGLYAKIVLVWLVVLTFSSMAVYNLQYGRHPVTGVRNYGTVESAVLAPVPSQILFTLGSDYEIHFTLKEKVSNLTFWLDGLVSHPVGEPRGSAVDNFYYSVRLPTLVPGREYFWGLDLTQRFPFRPMGPDDQICTVGDTSLPRSISIFDAIRSSDCGLVIHLGDMSYITNDGTCYPNQWDESCKYSCRGPGCAREARVTRARMYEWDKFFNKVNFSYTPLVTQMGNHDNDAFWYLKFRPVSSEPFLVNTSFYWSSDIVPGLRIISISTEDNNNNPYERWQRPRAPFDNIRWESNYGPNSTQYKWFKEQLNTNNTIIVYTHRPPFHTSNHHPDCGRAGSWYRCKYREVWGPLFDNVDYVFSGHSHHFMTTKPGVRVNKLGLLTGGRARFSIVGTGGYELETGYPLHPHRLIERMDNRHFGFALLNYRTNNLTFVKN